MDSGANLRHRRIHRLDDVGRFLLFGNPRQSLSAQIPNCCRRTLRCGRVHWLCRFSYPHTWRVCSAISSLGGVEIFDTISDGGGRKGPRLRRRPEYDCRRESISEVGYRFGGHVVHYRVGLPRSRAFVSARGGAGRSRFGGRGDGKSRQLAGNCWRASHSRHDRNPRRCS